jgi:hypothetical protein
MVRARCDDAAPKNRLKAGLHTSDFKEQSTTVGVRVRTTTVVVFSAGKLRLFQGTGFRAVLKNDIQSTLFVNSRFIDLVYAEG